MYTIFGKHALCGKGKESDPTDASANTSTNVLADTPPTRHRHVSRHTIDASANASLVCRPTHYRRVGQHFTGRYFPFLTIILSLSVEEGKNNFIRKEESVIVKQSPFLK